MENKEFFIECDGIKLHAKLDVPKEKQERYPCVIVVHGLTGHMEETHIKEVAKACNEVGYAALRVELYGHGKSEGVFRNHTIFHWVLELIQIVGYVHQMQEVTDIYLAGHSQGGAAVLLAAAIKEPYIKGILLLSPGMMLKDVAIHGGFPQTEYDPENLGEEVLLFGEYPLAAEYFRVCRMLPFDEAVQEFRKNVLIVHADTDELVPYRYAVKLQKQYNKGELVTIPGDDHCYTKHLAMVVEAVKAFLEKN